jgi:endogenous inhibitor of DNA gyrase (YacG/DUF329 family)
MSCPICNEQTDPLYRPFCSRRCADRDLSKWLDGSYAIPAEDAEMPAEEHGLDGGQGKPH